MDFKYKKYRCEWKVQFGTVDQYGRNFSPYESNSFPSRKKALLHLEDIGLKLHDLGRWIPKKAPHGYCEAKIVYEEILVEET